MIPPDSAKIPHDVDSDTPISHWIAVVSYDTEDNCEKALTNIQNSEQDPITLDKTGEAQAARQARRRFGQSARAQRRLRRQRRHPAESGQKVGVTRASL